MLATAGNESALALPPFRGLSEDDIEEWLSRFEKYVTYRGFPNSAKLNLLAVLLRDGAGDWLDTLDNATKNDWALMREAFRQRTYCSGNKQIPYGIARKVPRRALNNI